MWVSKRKWRVLKQRVADLEKIIQRQQPLDLEKGKELIKHHLWKYRSKDHR